MGPLRQAVPVLLAAAPAAHAWGALGHMTVGYIAQNLVQDSTAQWAQQILGITNSSYLASVAPWADNYRYTSAGAFSAPYHFIDAQDSPPKSCNVDYQRDCGSDGCSISAMLNYTGRVQNSKLGAEQVDMALKWIVHFIGDLHQPLHDEALDTGGNDIDVTFGSDDTNLHHIWDTDMPEKLVGGYALSDAENWAKNLTAEIQSGSYQSQSANWTSKDALSDPVSSTMVWATEANADVCSVVMPGGVDSVQNRQLDGSYYNGAISTVELQIAKAGVRLANWLDLIAANQTGGGSNKPRAQIRGEFPKTDQPLNKVQLARKALAGGCGDHRH